MCTFVVPRLSNAGLGEMRLASFVSAGHFLL